MIAFCADRDRLSQWQDHNLRKSCRTQRRFSCSGPRGRKHLQPNLVDRPGSQLQDRQDHGLA
jgi:hypothetical protein